MALFGISKKTEAQSKPTCSCGGNCSPEAIERAETKKNRGPSVKVLGSGCQKCKALEAVTRDALAELGMDTSVEHVTDFADIAAYGVMTTPALVIDGKVVSYGKTLTKSDVIRILKAERG